MRRVQDSTLTLAILASLVILLAIPAAADEPMLLVPGVAEFMPLGDACVYNMTSCNTPTTGLLGPADCDFDAG